MSVFLVQHGLSLPKAEDPEKGLSDRGREETLKIAEVAAGYGVKISKIFHSGKKRAEQTARMMAEILCPGLGIEQMADISAMADVKGLRNNFVEHTLYEVIRGGGGGVGSELC